MSYLSGALKALLDRRPGLNQRELADKAKVSQGQFSKYINDGSTPEAESINRLCAALPEADRAAIAVAYVRDCVPDSAKSLVTVRERETISRVNEQPTIDLPAEVRGAWIRIGERARDDADTADWLVGIDRILTAPAHRVLYEEISADSRPASREKRSSTNKAGDARSRSKATPPNAHR